MRTVHPLWRGFYLAVVWAVLRILLGPVDETAPFLLDRRMVALAGGVLAGAFLSALPSYLSRRRQKQRRSGWQRCVTAFLCGAAMVLAFRVAGCGWIWHALLEGSAGGAGFCLAALVGGFVTVRIAERGRRA